MFDARGEFPLELGAGEPGRLVDGKRTRERRGASVALVAGEDGAEVGEVEDFQLFGATDEAAQAAETEVGRKVERGAGDRGDGNSLLKGPVLLDQSPRMMDADGASTFAG